MLALDPQCAHHQATPAALLGQGHLADSELVVHSIRPVVRTSVIGERELADSRRLERSHNDLLRPSEGIQDVEGAPLGVDDHGSLHFTAQHLVGLLDQFPKSRRERRRPALHGEDQRRASARMHEGVGDAGHHPVQVADLSALGEEACPHLLDVVVDVERGHGSPLAPALLRDLVPVHADLLQQGRPCIALGQCRRELRERRGQVGKSAHRGQAGDPRRTQGVPASGVAHRPTAGEHPHLAIQRLPSFIHKARPRGHLPLGFLLRRAQVRRDRLAPLPLAGAVVARREVPLIVSTTSVGNRLPTPRLRQRLLLQHLHLIGERGHPPSLQLRGGQQLGSGQR
jgi:hypothetical protein